MTLELGVLTLEEFCVSPEEMAYQVHNGTNSGLLEIIQPCSSLFQRTT